MNRCFFVNHLERVCAFRRAERSRRLQERSTLHQEGSRSSSGASGSLRELPKDLPDTSEHLLRAFENLSRPNNQKQLSIPQNDTRKYQNLAKNQPKTVAHSVERRQQLPTESRSQAAQRGAAVDRRMASYNISNGLEGPCSNCNYCFEGLFF